MQKKIQIDMRKFLFGLLLIPTLCFSQNKGYFSIAAIGDFPANINSGYGVHFTGNGQVSQFLYLGGGVGFTKFERLNKPVIPLFGNITIILGSENKIHPMLFIQPGYGVYNNGYTKGGFYFNTDIAIGFPGKAKPFLAFGYSSYSFNTEYLTFSSKGRYGGPAFRIGCRFK